VAETGQPLIAADEQVLGAEVRPEIDAVTTVPQVALGARWPGTGPPIARAAGRGGIPTNWLGV
jgi:hypothetical protein